MQAYNPCFSEINESLSLIKISFIHLTTEILRQDHGREKRGIGIKSFLR